MCPPPEAHYRYRSEGKNLSDINEIEVSSGELAHLLDLSEPRVRQLAQAGVLVRGSKRGSYRLAESFRGFNRHRNAELDAPARLRKEARLNEEHRRFMAEQSLKDGSLVPAAMLHNAVAAIQRAAGKSFQRLDTELVNALWPKGIKDIGFVNSTLNACEVSFCDWMHAALDMILRGASADDVRVYLFNAHSVPPAGPVEFGTEQTQRRRQKSAQAE